jgi:hypothetical protein
MVEPDPHPHLTVRIGVVVLRQRPLDALGAAQPVQHRSEGQDEPVAQEGRLPTTARLHLSPHDRLMRSKNLVGELIATPAPQLG